MAFVETRFPTDLSFGSQSAPNYKTTVVVLGSGYEQRNAAWSQGRNRYDAAYGMKTVQDLEQVIIFFNAMEGRLHGFRFKDPLDYNTGGYGLSNSTTDVVIGTGDGATATFQLVKKYTKGTRTTTRTITKPVSGTVLVAVDGTPQVESTDFTVDTTTGIITFISSPLPSGSITAGFDFDIPCRFDVDELPFSIEDLDAGAVSVPIVEIRV